MTSLTLSGLHIYPVKSAAGIAQSESLLTSRGLQFDRRWMVVSPDGRFMTQRRFPSMALITVDLLEEHLRVSAPDMSPLLVSMTQAGDFKDVEVWGDRTQSIDAGKAAQSWFRSIFTNALPPSVYAGYC